MASNGAETASQSGKRGSSERSGDGRFRAFAARAAGRLADVFRTRSVRLAAAVVVLGGLLLAYAETLDLYRILTPSGSVSNAAGSVRTGGDQHSWALAVIGVAGAGAAILAASTRQRFPALAAVALAAIALVTVLAFDLPDVTASGVTTDLEVGDAEPAAGFWMELAGAVVMTVGSVALAVLLRRAGDEGRPRTGAPR